MNIAKYIDQTLLKPDATKDEITKLIVESRKYNFASICINPYWVEYAAKQLADTNIAITTVIGFPLGAVTTVDKVREAENALENNADELDMVINIGQLKSGEYDQVLEDMKAVVEIVHSQRKIIKVIIETCLLTDAEKIKACNLVRESGADFIKTSTGFSMGGATLHDVKLLKKTLTDTLKIKASGGIHSRQEALEMIEVGADRLGTSSGIEIVSDFE